MSSNNRGYRQGRKLQQDLTMVAAVVDRSCRHGCSPLEHRCNRLGTNRERDRQKTSLRFPLIESLRQPLPSLHDSGFADE